MHQAMHPIWPRDLSTLADWEALPEEDWYRRTEVAEGILQFLPGPPVAHQMAMMKVSWAISNQGEPHITAVPSVEVLLELDPLTIRTPDVVAVPAALMAIDLPRFTPDQVELAVEVISTGTRRVDRVMKVSEYADAGIPQSWIVDVDEPITLLAYVLVDGAYQLSGEHTGLVTLDVAGHPVTLDLAALTRR